MLGNWSFIRADDMLPAHERSPAVSCSNRGIFQIGWAGFDDEIGAAKVLQLQRRDGCIPIITPSLVMTALFSMIATLQVFAEPTTLRPLTNSLSTSWSPLMLVYRDPFLRDDIYSAAATSIIIALASFVISFVFLRLVQRRAFGQEDPS